MSWQAVKIGDFLKRSKIPIDIEDSEEYKRVTIKGKHQGVSLRDIERGKNIGTKKQFVLKEGQFILSKIDARYGAFGIAPKEVDDAIKWNFYGNTDCFRHGCFNAAGEPETYAEYGQNDSRIYSATTTRI